MGGCQCPPRKLCWVRGPCKVLFWELAAPFPHKNGSQGFSSPLESSHTTPARLLNTTGTFSPFISLLDPFPSEIRFETRLRHLVNMYLGQVAEHLCTSFSISLQCEHSILIIIPNNNNQAWH